MAKKINISLDIKGEELKRKLNIKDGKDGLPGKDGKDAVVDEAKIALEASKIAQVELESKIPTIPQIVEQLPVIGEKVRDSLELLQGDERLDISAINGLDDYDEIAQLAREPKLLEKKIIASGGGVKSLQEVTDVGATTTNTITVPSVQFDTSANVTVDEGELAWNATDETLDLGMPDGIVLQIGQENQIKTRNSTGSTISNGKVVYVSGVLGNRPQISLAQGNAHATGHIIGMTTQDIADNTDGKVTTSGYVRDINTTGSLYGETWNDGDTLWLSKTIAGGLTKTEPAVPHHSAIVGIVTRAHATQGSILVNITQHQRLESLSDVNGTPLASDGQIPIWHNTSKYFDFDKSIYKQTDFYESRNVTISRNANNYISSFAVSGGRTLTPTRDGNGYISSITDGSKTWTFTRTNGYITSITVS